MTDCVIPEIKATEDEMIAIRHYLHAHPELSLEEFNTSELVAGKLTEWGYTVTRGLAKTGVVGTLSKGDSYQGADRVVQDLESGRIDGAVLSGMMADYSFLQQPQGKDFAFVGGHLKDDKLFGAGAAIGLRKEDDALRQEINGAIATILADGTYKKLAGKYFSFDVYSGT